MAYQSVGTPRFWVSTLQWLNSKGLLYWNNTSFSGANLNLFNLNPVNGNVLTGGATADDYFAINAEYGFQNIMINDNNFYMVLGHNFGSIGLTNLYLKTAWDSGQSTNYPLATNAYVNSMVNFNSEGYDGYSINIGSNGHDFAPSTVEGDASPDDATYIKFRLDGSYSADTQINIGSILYGTYYTMPHSPDLNLTMTREYGGTKTLETKGGATLTNSYWTKQPNWSNGLGAWELGSGGLYADRDMALQALSDGGRRIWNLSFSYLDEENLFPKMTSLTDYQTGTQTVENPYLDNTLLQENSFYSQVLLKTLGAGNLPFVFQPDKDDTTNFAICMFDQDSFQFKQVANGVYNISMKIRELW